MSSQSPQKSRPYLTLDAWRGFAALWVVLAHAALSTPFTHVSPFVSQYQRFYAFNLAGYLGVQIFFVISGYCIASSVVSCLRRENGLKEFVQARLRRIYPPYFFAMFLAVLCSRLGAAVFEERPEFTQSALAHLDFFHHSLGYYLTNLTLTAQPLNGLQILPVSWTLDYEITFYGLMSLALFALIRRRDKFLLLNVLHLLTAGTLLLLMLMPRGVLFPFDLWPQFGLGVLAYDLLTHPGRAFARRVTAVIVVQILLFALIYSRTGGASLFEHWRHSTFPSRVLVCLVFFSILLALYRHDEALSRFRLVRALAWVGRFSYTLYLTHFVCVNMLSVVGDMFGVTAHSFPLLYLTKIVAAVLLARLLFPLMEKPFMHARPRTLREKANTSTIDVPVTIPRL